MRPGVRGEAVGLDPAGGEDRALFQRDGQHGQALVDAGADGLVLFNRFLQPDFDLDSLETKPRLVLSTPFEMLLPLRWIAILSGRLKASLALTSGLHDAEGLIKALLAVPTWA